jgi:hypothetical protein
VGLERGPLSLVSTVEELLGRKSSGFGLENQYYGRRDPPRWPRYSSLSVTNFADKGGRSVGIVRSRTKATELLLREVFMPYVLLWNVCVTTRINLIFYNTIGAYCSLMVKALFYKP